MDRKREKDKRERVGLGIKIKGYDDIFDDVNTKPNTDDNRDRTVLVAPSKLRDFRDHPFKLDGKGIEELVASIGEHGILSPIIVRPCGDIDASGEYEIISGHRRKFCAERLGLENIPVIVRDIGDDEAVLAMVDSNIQREDILPSEKAFAYKMKLEAIKRQGERTDLAKDLTCGQVVHKLRSADKIGMENNDSGRQIRRYVRLTELPSSFLNAIDSKKMSFNAGVELSYLSKENKKAVEDAAAEINKFPTLSQSKEIREMADKRDNMTAVDVLDVLMGGKKSEAVLEDCVVNFNMEEIRSFFPKEFTVKQIEDEIIKILRERGGVGL